MQVGASLGACGNPFLRLPAQATARVALPKARVDADFCGPLVHRHWHLSVMSRDEEDLKHDHSS